MGTKDATTGHAAHAKYDYCPGVEPVRGETLGFSTEGTLMLQAASAGGSSAGSGLHPFGVTLVGLGGDTWKKLLFTAVLVVAVILVSRIVRWLLRERLLDELWLMLHPIVVGSGKRLFPDGIDRLPLKLAQSQTFSTGVLSLMYQPADI